jgi:hypothetical protein
MLARPGCGFVPETNQIGTKPKQYKCSILVLNMRQAQSERDLAGSLAR